jgi:hypothetical protein
MKRPGRVIVAPLLAGLLAAGLAVAGPGAGVAHAVTTFTQVSDGFESGFPFAPGRWERFTWGGGQAWYDSGIGVAHTGQNDGWLYVAGNGWAAERIGMDLSGQYSSTCWAAVWMQPTGAGAQAGLQVWNPNGWHLIAASYPWLTGNGSGYQLVIVPLNLSGFAGPVYLQAIYGTSSGTGQYVRVDDMSLTCN